MSVEKLLNHIRLQASLANSGKTFTELGEVIAYDPTNYLVIVQIYPATEDDPAFKTGWIPLFSPWVGNGWGMFCPPNLGDIMAVEFQSGSLQSPLGAMKTFTNNARPLPVPSGEFWLVHQSGSYIKLTNDSKVAINSAVQIDLTAPIINLNSETISLGNLSGDLQPLLNALNNPTVNVRAT